MAQNGSLESFFVLILSSSWGSPQPALENGLEWLWSEDAMSKIAKKQRGFIGPHQKGPMFLHGFWSVRPGIAQKQSVFIGFPESAPRFYVFWAHSGLELHKNTRFS